jgi:hypothetical protein
MATIDRGRGLVPKPLQVLTINQDERKLSIRGILSG